MSLKYGKSRQPVRIDVQNDQIIRQKMIFQRFSLLYFESGWLDKSVLEQMTLFISVQMRKRKQFQTISSRISKIDILGVDIIMDPLNGEDSVRGYDLLKPMGRIIYFGKNLSQRLKNSIFETKSWF